MSKQVFEFHIIIDNSQVTAMEGPYGAVCFIPFGGYVESPLFSGTIVPGAADIQVEDQAGYRNMCAKYMFKGTDSEGKECFLFVENNGWLQDVNKNDPFIKAHPRFMTDSLTLGAYVCQDRFRSEVHGAENGVTIKIIDVLA